MNDKQIWDLLIKEVGNPYGVAGLMGNLFAESSLNPACKTGGTGINGKMSESEYVNDINEAEITGDSFSHDGVAFGLAQWKYWSRKEQMFLRWCDYNATHGTTSIADIPFQINFLLKEIKTYKTVWSVLLSAKTVKEASDIVLERYEKPASVSDKTKEKRAGFGQGYFDKFAGKKTPQIDTPRVRTIKKNVNIRRGNGKKYGVITQIPNLGTAFTYVTKVGDWYAVEVVTGKLRQVGWISVDCAELC